MKRGDIVVAVTPGDHGKSRPAVVVQSDIFNATHASITLCPLQEPPVEKVPIPDFRTVANEHIERPSPDLLETVYLCQQRQEWYRDYARPMGEEPLAFVGSVRVGDDVVRTATHPPRARIRH